MAVVVHVVLRGLTPEQYDQVRERVGWLDAPPAGGLTHLSWWEDDDNHNTDAWESDADFLAFAENRLGPVLAELGIDIQPEVTFQPAYEVFAPERVVDVMPSEPPLALGMLVTGTESASGEPALFRIDAATGAETAISVGGSFSAPVGIAVEADGSILVADADAFGGTGGIIRVDPATGEQTEVSSGGLFSNPFDLAVESSGTIVVADPHARGAGAVIRVDPRTGEQQMVSSGGEAPSALPLREVGITLDADGNILVVEQTLAGGAQGKGRVTRIDPADGARTAVSSDGMFASAVGVAVEADGNILVADANAFGGKGGVIRVDPATGEQTEVASRGSFVGPVGIDIDSDGAILVADGEAFAGRGGVIRVDPATGTQSTVSTGTAFQGHSGLAVG